MKFYINKIAKQDKFKLSNEVTILCSIDELKNLMSFVVNTYNSLSKVSSSTLPHSHYKDYLKKEKSDSPDIIIVLEKKEKNPVPKEQRGCDPT